MKRKTVILIVLSWHLGETPAHLACLPLPQLGLRHCPHHNPTTMYRKGLQSALLKMATLGIKLPKALLF